MVGWKHLCDKPFQAGYRAMLERIYRLPDGQISSFTIIDSGPVVVILALTPERNVIIAKQFRPGPNKIMYELPGGAVEQNENILAAAERELFEETGYAGNIELIQSYYMSGYSTLIRHCCLATNCQKIGQQRLDPTEHIEVEVMAIDEFAQHLQAGDCVDMAAAILGLRKVGLM